MIRPTTFQIEFGITEGLQIAYPGFMEKRKHFIISDMGAVIQVGDANSKRSAE